jgi:hypothetical protein
MFSIRVNSEFNVDRTANRRDVNISTICIVLSTGLMLTVADGISVNTCS